MDITPPTDNLYKFMAVGGLVLIIAGVTVPPVFFQQTGFEYLAQLRGSDELKVHQEFARQRQETLNHREQQARDEKQKLQKRLDELNSSSNSADVEKLEGRIKETNREIESIEDATHELQLNLALKQAQIRYEDTVSFNRRYISRFFLFLGWIVGLLGIFISFIGFRRWYKRYQKYQDLLAAKEAEAKLAAPIETNKKSEEKRPAPPVEVAVSKPAEPTPVNVPQPTK